MKPFAFPAAKAPQRSELFVADERLEFVAAQQSARDGFPNRKITVLICAGETLESLDDRRTALRASAKRFGVGHVLVGMKMLGFTDDVFRQLPDVAHEGIARELAMFNFAQAEFPFAGQFRAGQFRHRVLKQHDRLNCLCGGLQLLTLSGQIMR